MSSTPRIPKIHGSRADSVPPSWPMGAVTSVSSGVAERHLDLVRRAAHRHVVEARGEQVPGRGRAEVDGVVQIGEGRIAGHGRPPVGRHGVLGVDDEMRSGAGEAVGVPDMGRLVFDDPGHDERFAVQRPVDQRHRPGRGDRHIRLGAPTTATDRAPALSTSHREAETNCWPDPTNGAEVTGEGVRISPGDLGDLGRGGQRCLGVRHRRGEHVPRLLGLEVEQPALRLGVERPGRPGHGGRDQEADHQHQDGDTAGVIRGAR